MGGWGKYRTEKNPKCFLKLQELNFVGKHQWFPVVLYKRPTFKKKLWMHEIWLWIRFVLQRTVEKQVLPMWMFVKRSLNKQYPIGILRKPI